jgi:hypothetical protein
MELGKERKEKRVMESTISKHVILVQVEDIAICIKSC